MSSPKTNITRNIQGKKLHKCQICEEAFSRNIDLNQYYEIYSGENSYSFDICHKDFSLLNNCKQHRKMHAGEKSHVCDVCSKSFLGSSVLSNMTEYILKSNHMSHDMRFRKMWYVRTAKPQISQLPAHTYSLMRAFACRLNILRVLSY